MIARNKIDKAKADATNRRFIANELLGNSVFVEWIGGVMTRNGYFDNREMTPYSQGVRNGIAREAERLFECADDGNKIFAEIFYANIGKYNKMKD